MYIIKSYKAIFVYLLCMADPLVCMRHFVSVGSLILALAYYEFAKCTWHGEYSVYNNYTICTKAIRKSSCFKNELSASTFKTLVHY